ncbi:hypothetical protein GCM10009601_41660 [Streptomyces thermospinosisporus]|uniref:Uncharacterized protein n=1 Tax=Streptomyces thermospinosisporus TaxID=161482 RepID=A0ABN1Z254_9ACTN
MGDHFQTIVDLDATPAEAEALADRALHWLVSEGIVLAQQTTCVLGAPAGHPPGEHWAKAVIDPDWEPTDGLAVETGRTVFHGGQGGAQYAICPKCAARTDFFTETWEPIDGADDAFFEAINTWHKTGKATVTCSHCASASDLRAWKWADDYYAFAYLGSEFWNWPEFTPRFLADFAQVLEGHRVVRVWGKL